MAAAKTEFVAFVDADCDCLSDWARPLAGLLEADPNLALAAPRVRSAIRPGVISRYERSRSPLDMGPRPALVGHGSRVRFLPSAALVARRAALRELGGFDPQLRFGEDVDLAWRALDAGWSVRYAPDLEIEHLPRPSLAGVARQRFGYGRSAAPLDRRHPGAVAPMQVDRGTGLVLLGAGLGGRRGAVLAALAYVACSAGNKRDADAMLPLGLSVAQGLLKSGRHLARATARDWMPLTLCLALASRRVRPYAAAALAVDGVTGAGHRPRLLLGSGPLLRLVENSAYTAGLWCGALSARSPGPLLPRRPQRRRKARGLPPPAA